MALAGIHHLTTLTADMDRLIDFYERLFDAEVTLDVEEEGLRHAFIDIGQGTLLHPFELSGVDVPQCYIPMFKRGRMDHFGLSAATEEEFWEMRERVMQQGAGDGLVSDMGPFLSFAFIDPDGVGHEVMWTKPDASAESCLPRSDWTVVQTEGEPKRPSGVAIAA
jgi:catechol 2,3-dioxygenase-like lactoylglutathione lyase family enzyme